MKLVLIAAVSCFALGLGADDANAQGRSGRQGTMQNTTPGKCPAGTCSPSGTPFASNINNCSATYCSGRPKRAKGP
jgi:hypothetical protein